MSTLLFLLNIFFIPACSSQVQDDEKVESKKMTKKNKTIKKIKPEISTTKPNTSKNVSELEPAKKDPNVVEKIIPIGDPLKEKFEEKEKEKEKTELNKEKSDDDHDK